MPTKQALVSKLTAKPLPRNFRQHRTILGTRLTCIIFRHIAQKSSAIHKVLSAVFRRSDENSDCAIRAPELCGVAFTVRDLDALMSKCNCEKYQGGRGSWIGYRHIPTGRAVQFDSPHPGKELYLYQVKAVIAFLRDIGEL